MEKIAVIGIGRLGLCLALNLERAGYAVLGVDVAEDYVAAVNSRVLSSPEPFVTEYLSASKNLNATTRIDEIFEHHVSSVFIVVPTPSLPAGGFDHAAIDQIIHEIARRGKQDVARDIIISSTTMPGYCDSVTDKVGVLNYNVSYNPEFIAQGSIIENQLYPDQVLIGAANAEAGNSVERIYRRMCKNEPVFCHMSMLSAEITKLATNCFLTTKIAFANAIGDLAVRAGAEPEKILQAIGADKRIGGKYLRYGFGYGGPCFPRDNKAFTTYAANSGCNMLISEATDAANGIHGNFLLGQWLENNPGDEIIEFNSVTYKEGTDILEESQQLKLAIALAGSHRKVLIREQAAVIKQLRERYGDLFIYETQTNQL